MPEGHSIHRLARQFQDTFVGQRVRASSPQGRFADGAALLDGHIPVESAAHGKHFFLTFDHGLMLNVHLGMYGAWTFGGDHTFTAASSIGAPRRIGEREVHRASAEPDHQPPDDDRPAPADTSGDATAGRDAVVPPEPTPTTRVRLVTRHGWADLVGSSVCRVLTSAEVEAVRSGLGPDPLDPQANAAEFVRRASRTGRTIGAVLMDQSVIAGVGNIFRAETLFRRGIDPHRPARSLTEQQLLGLWEDLVLLMGIGVRNGRIITTAAEHRPGVPEPDAWPEQANYVYQRHGQPCLVCGESGEGVIVREEMVQRKLYRCTVCQV